MRGVHRTQRLIIVFCLAAGIFASPIVASAQSSEIPGLQVSGALPEPIHQGETFAVTFEVTNAGASPFEQVVVTPQDACSPSSTGGLFEFEEILGNGDDLLDPGEVWSYLAPQCIDSAFSIASVDVSVFDGVETVTSNYPFEYSPVSPLAVGQLGEVSADECLVNRFAIPLEVVTSTPFSVTGAFLAYAIPQISGFEVVDLVEFAELSQVSGNGDAVFDPGEEWLAVFFFGSLGECPEVPDPPLALLLSMEGTSVDSGAPWCFGTEACPHPSVQVGTITELVPDVEAAPPMPAISPTPDPTLPFTGPSVGGVAVMAAALLASGVLLLAVGRRSTEP